ncbi:histidine phosphatase family protein [Pseudorhodoferax sp. Leaf267]|uniref:histidine phosphatase family protein n=1 Tax=Pseudorhodoferax sp. Leaf267 TaxID=1736316 RepID=UPI0006F1E37B|nr:histidine phosphatase family protein [Pseudorhodoferax sp. Leaf267]KQP23275.1 hypothetical protein ASF43_05230 [Pseudorhodoferax sp. Leaf267]
MQLWLVRHAALPQAAGLCYGATDLAADAAHTEATALRLAAQLPPIARAWCSPLQRCRVLADRLQALQPGLAIASDARLAEMDFGAWECQPWDAIGAAALDAWTDDFAAYRPGGGESVAQLMQRVGAALRHCAAMPAAHGLWITHAGVIKTAQWLASGRPPIAHATQWPRESVAFGAWTVLDLPTGGTAAAAPA